MSAQEQPVRPRAAAAAESEDDINDTIHDDDRRRGSQVANGSECLQEKETGKQMIADSSPGGDGQVSPRRITITIGEALEATALTAGDRAVDYGDAAAIQAAEVRATGRTSIVPGGVAAAAQSAASRNARATCERDKTKLSEILSDASSKLPCDKAVTRRDAEGVIGAEVRNDPNLCTRPGGVAASVAAAARLNSQNSADVNHD